MSGSNPFDVTGFLRCTGPVGAWVQAQQAFLRFAGPGFAAAPGAGPSPQAFADTYRQLFAIPGLPSGMPEAATPGPWVARYQQAAERFGRLLNEIALDAGRRLAAALAESGPEAAPITSLRELHTLWIDCGEAAWSAAAHREEFAAALAELLAALVVLRAPGAGP